MRSWDTEAQALAWQQLACEQHTVGVAWTFFRRAARFRLSTGEPLLQDNCEMEHISPKEGGLEVRLVRPTVSREISWLLSKNLRIGTLGMPTCRMRSISSS